MPLIDRPFLVSCRAVGLYMTWFKLSLGMSNPTVVNDSVQRDVTADQTVVTASHDNLIEPHSEEWTRRRLRLGAC